MCDMPDTTTTLAVSKKDGVGKKGLGGEEVWWRPSCCDRAAPFIRHMRSAQTHADIPYGDGQTRHNTHTHMHTKREGNLVVLAKK